MITAIYPDARRKVIMIKKTVPYVRFTVATFRLVMSFRRI
jgi:hypothetical protein